MARSTAVRSVVLILVSLGLSSCGAPSSPFRANSYPAVGSFARTHGPALIREGDFSANADRVPWSGYWYPLSRIDARSALEKYDRLTGGRSLNFEEERIRHESHPFLPWEGRCDAWAFASILQAEPRVPIDVEIAGNQERFTIAEQKALWIFAHEKVDVSSRGTVGVRNEGDGTSPFEDLLPDEFHRILQVILQERHLPFIMDRDPRPPVWNTPVYGARWSIEQDSNDRGLFHVHASVYAVFPYEENLDSSERIAPVMDYFYDLLAHPVEGGFEVHGSRWVGRSIREHPDFVTVIHFDDLVSTQSQNPEIDVRWLRTHLISKP